MFIDRTQSVHRNDDVSSKAAMNIIPRHLLVGANSGFATSARIANSARDDGGDDHRLIDPIERVGTDIHNASANLVTECEGEIVLGPHAVVVKAEISMTNAAPGNFDQYFVGSRDERIEFRRY